MAGGPLKIRSDPRLASARPGPPAVRRFPGRRGIRERRCYKCTRPPSSPRPLTFTASQKPRARGTARVAARMPGIRGRPCTARSPGPARPGCGSARRAPRRQPASGHQGLAEPARARPPCSRRPGLRPAATAVSGQACGRPLTTAARRSRTATSNVNVNRRYDRPFHVKRPLQNSVRNGRSGWPGARTRAE